MAGNLFSTLSKYNTYAPENYLTEALVYLLKVLLDRSPDEGLRIVNQLVHFIIGEAFQSTENVSIRTQAAVENGTPDIEITDGKTRLAYVEVKHDSPLHTGQLENYFQDLKQAGIPVTNLVLLTRSKSSRFETTLQPNQYQHTCWYEIYNWLGEANTGEPVCEYLIRQFQDFLEEKGMSLHRVTWEYENGVKAMLDLTAMLEAAVEEAIPDCKAKKSGGWSWRGFYLYDVFIGLYYEHPMVITFANKKGMAPTFKRDLNLNQSYFLALSKDEQFEQIVEFVLEANEEYLASGLASLTADIVDENDVG